MAVTEPIADENGYVTSYASLTPLGGNVRLQNGGVPAQTGVHGVFSYSVSYAVGEPGGPARNVRTDVATNTRPGVRLVKVDGSGNPLPGAVFTLKDGSGNDVTKAGYTSGADGLITYAYFDLYVDAFRIYDPAGSEEDGMLTSSVIKEVYQYSDEANEQFSTLHDMIVGAETMGDVSADAKEAQEGTVLVDGDVALTTPQINDYAQFGPNHELYLRKGIPLCWRWLSKSWTTVCANGR